MKKFVLVLFSMVVCVATFAQSQKVVVANNGEVLGYYVKTNATTYSVDGQDSFTVPIKGHKVVVFSAEKGQGIVRCKNYDTVNVRSAPSVSSAKVGTLRNILGYAPETALCLGKKNGWYKVLLYNNKVGYIRQDLVVWEAIDLY